VFLISNAFAAFYSPIQDCDEVFNYWEPAHYLNHGYGLQTWEYSPEYSIRSWFYIIIHAVIGKAVSLFTPRKTVEFYTIRFMLAFICTVCETRLYLVICQARSRVVGLLFLVIMAFSPGMFHASAAFLPSSFAMYSSMLGLAAFLDGNHITEGIIWFGIGAVLGWPFAAVLIVPFLVERAIVAIRTGHIQPTLNNIARGVIGCFIILV
jgi:alpha-1,2-mannosyltransferase